jgi:transposase InsO family protein
MRFAFVQAHAAEYRVTTLCRVLGVSKAGYYAWVTRGPSRRAREDAALVAAIRGVHAAHGGLGRTYGSPRVHRELRAAGRRHGEKRIARVMREQGLRATARRRFRVTTQSAPLAPVAPNVLARQFTVARLNRAWVGDLTYLRTDAGWLYLAVVLDLASRRVVGWAMRHTMDEGLVQAALAMAVQQRQPPPGLVHHTDRGSQYAATDYRAQLARQQMIASMSRPGDCWDNAVAESFFATLKRELADEAQWRTRDAARSAVFHYIETWYNPPRRHSALDYVSPVQYEQQLRLLEPVA